ncbi:alpha/beta fold hydrolase [Cupriavidus sp. D39]|uniref:alpha/beta fold hydrolase n=1 Tax=Cupriavidus sp. D39 TaxID=2997877 RepID=UPI00226D9868|nr:alpha/beta hydrolase [Cupriavidus sp. D39]MCY0858576.1 alpha/beta hydrolase [Cupriavidus sp. D39]
MTRLPGLPTIAGVGSALIHVRWRAAPIARIAGLFTSGVSDARCGSDIGALRLARALRIQLGATMMTVISRRPPHPPGGRFLWLSPTKKDLEMNRLVLSTQSSSAGLGYVQHGTGPECVLVMHDWLGDHSNYDAAIPYLDGTRFTYVFVDLRGYGLSMQLSGAYTVEEIAADCLDLADRLGWQRFHLVGHSMTGMATQRIAADAPSRIKSAIAVCPISAAGNRLSPEALAFFTTTGDSDDAFRRLVKYVTGGLSDRWADFKLRQNRAMIAPECRSGGIPKHARTGELCRRHSRARHAISDHRGR